MKFMDVDSQEDLVEWVNLTAFNDEVRAQFTELYTSLMDAVGGDYVWTLSAGVVVDSHGKETSQGASATIFILEDCQPGFIFSLREDGRIVKVEPKDPSITFQPKERLH